MKRIILILLAIAIPFAQGYSADKAPKTEKVKNVILVIGDGMGLAAASSWMIDNHNAPTSFDRAQLSGSARLIPPTTESLTQRHPGRLWLVESRRKTACLGWDLTLQRFPV